MSSRSGRKHIRKIVEFPLRVRVISGARIGAGEIAGMAGTATSFSIGGIGFETVYPFETGDLLAVLFQLPGESKQIIVEATVQSVRKVERKSQDPRLVHVGLKFQNVPAPLMTYFMNYMSSTFLLT